MTLSDGGSYFFLIFLQAGRQADRQVACLALPCLVVTVCVMNHHMGRGAKPPKRTVLFFFLGAEQDREENPSISSYIYTHCTHIHTRTRERDEEGGNKKR